MRVLIISNAEWDDSNSFGNTFSNLFSFLPKDDVANIYCREGSPETDSCSHFLRMGEKDVLRFLFRRGDFQEVKVALHDDRCKTQTKCTNILNRFVKQHRWLLFFILRELIWSISGWRKSKSLASFVEYFNPDIIVLPTYSFSYINKLALFLSEKYNLPIVSYVSDDEYSYNPFIHSLSYRLNKNYQRKWIKRSIDKSEILYVISDIQKKEYTPIFGDKCKVLTKGGVFEKKPEPLVLHNPIRIVFIGNIGTGRWKSLSMLAESIEKINESSIKFTLDIYTGTLYTEEMKNAFARRGTAIHGFVSPKEAHKIVDRSDILLHVESFDKVDEFAVHQSLSTKIVDYLTKGKGIIGVGPASVASIAFLKDNDIAFVASHEEEIETLLDRIWTTPQVVLDYSRRAWDFGAESCNIKNIHKMLYDDFERVIKNN